MNVAMFIVGFCIFIAYVGFLMWNIFYNHNKNREENYPGYYSRHKQPNIEIMRSQLYVDDKKKVSKSRRSNKRKKVKL